MYLKIRMSTAVWKMYKLDGYFTFMKGEEIEFREKTAERYGKVIHSIIKELNGDTKDPLPIIDHNLPLQKQHYTYNQNWPNDSDLTNYPDYIKGIYCRISDRFDTNQFTDHILIFSGKALIVADDQTIIETL